MTQTHALTADQACATAAALAAGGHAEQAEKLYRAALTLEPDRFDGLHALGLLCLDRNAPQEAVPLLARALSVNPDSAEAHNDMGTALARQAKQSEALPHFERAVALSPEFAAAYNNLGNSLAALDRRREAIPSFKRAIALRPRYALAEFNLANALAKSERHREAVDHFRLALEYQPSWVVALCALGYSLNMSNYPDEALQTYEKARILAPLNAEVYQGMGLVLQTLGRLEESQITLEKALELAPHWPAHHRALGEAKHFHAGDPQIAAMEDLLPTITSLGDEQQAELHFALGKAYGDLDRHEEAFRHLLEGNAIKHRLDEYDEAAHLEMLKHIQTVFTADLLKRNAGAGDPSQVPIFILGMPRSGSTLTEQIVASHPQIFGAGELRDFGEATKTFSGRGVAAFFPEVVTSLSGEQLRAFGARYVEHVRALGPKADRVTDKMPANFRFIGFIHMTLPNAKIIHTRRDPLDTCISCFSRMFGKKSFMADLGTLGRYYRAYETLMEHWRNVLPQGAMLEVQYEDLVADFENQARRIVAYCGVEWDERCLTFYQNVRPVRTASVLQVRQPIYSRAIGRSKPYEMMLRPLLDELNKGNI